MGKHFSILIIPGMIPFPHNDGGKVCIYGFIDYLRMMHNISIILNCHSEDDTKNVIELERKWPNVKIYYNVVKKDVKRKSIIDYSKAILRRIISIARRNSTNQNTLEGLNIYRTTPFFPSSIEFIKRITKVIQSSQYDIIQTELTEGLNLVHLFPKEVKKVFVQIENRGLVLNDYGQLNNVDETYLSYVVKNTEFLEFKYMSLYDAILTLNEDDKVRIQKNVANIRVYSSPFAILDQDIINPPDLQSFGLRNLIFIGGENHYPNADGLRWFLKYSEKKIDKNLIDHIYISGHWSDKIKREFKDLDPRVIFIGFVENLTTFFRNSISIVPIRIGGGGIRTKILLSMAQCSPVVSTGMAAIGVEGKKEEFIKIADNIDDFVHEINTLLNDKNSAYKIVLAGNKLIRTNYSQTYTSMVRNKIYEEIMNELL